jgi:hypothetical protein
MEQASLIETLIGTAALLSILALGMFTVYIQNRR